MTVTMQQIDQDTDIAVPQTILYFAATLRKPRYLKPKESPASVRAEILPNVNARSFR